MLAVFTGRGAASDDGVEEARALAKRGAPARAQALLDRRLADEPSDAAARRALGDVLRQRCDLPLAEVAFRRALELDFSDAAARSGLAEVLILDGRASDALAEAQRAIDDSEAAGQPSSRAWRIKALALAELRRYDLALEAARAAVSLAPTEARCAECLAAVEFRAGRMDLAGASYARAVRLDPTTEEANLRLGNGFGPECPGKPWHDGEDAVDFQRAVAAWDRGDLEAALLEFLSLADRRPDAYKYRLGIGLARLSLRRSRETYLGGDTTALYATIPAPEIEGLAEVVPGYELLGPLERHVVRVATAPARPLWAAIVAAGATHEVVPLAADLTDGERRHDLVHRRTFDGRWYEHLRGVAGSQGATGAEKLREAAEFAFNTFAHEFGHQVHRHGLTLTQQATVDGFYAAARAAGTCLDYYAASSPDEYFAQGYEAFVSPVKRGCLTETARHTRDELARRDPALFNFLTSVLDTSYERPETLAALRAAAIRATPPSAEPASR